MSKFVVIDTPAGDALLRAESITSIGPSTVDQFNNHGRMVRMVTVGTNGFFVFDTAQNMRRMTEQEQ